MEDRISLRAWLWACTRRCRRGENAQSGDMIECVIVVPMRGRCHLSKVNATGHLINHLTCRMKSFFKDNGRFVGVVAAKSSAARAFVAGALAVCAYGVAVASEQASPPRVTQALKPCRSLISLEGRIVIEHWAPAKSCKMPIRTRATDRFLGFSCLLESASCRPFYPPPKSRVFDSSRFFRCVDFAVVDNEMGFAITRMREWVSPSKTCDWVEQRHLPQMEVDFARREVCVGGLCMSVGRLSPIGQVRLRHLIGKALRDLGMASDVKITR